MKSVLKIALCLILTILVVDNAYFYSNESCNDTLVKERAKSEKQVVKSGLPLHGIIDPREIRIEVNTDSQIGRIKNRINNSPIFHLGNKALCFYYLEKVNYVIKFFLLPNYLDLRLLRI